MDIEIIIRRFSERESFSAGDVIFQEGEAASKMYLIAEGEVDLSVQGEPLGVEVVNGSVGEMAMVDPASRMTTAKAKTDCKLVPIERNRFLDLIREYPEFSLHVMELLADRLRLANNIRTKS